MLLDPFWDIRTRRSKLFPKVIAEISASLVAEEGHQKPDALHAEARDILLNILQTLGFKDVQTHLMVFIANHPPALPETNTVYC